jgi:hypothetical protein
MNYRILLLALFVITSLKVHAMQSSQDPNQALLDAVKAKNVNAAHAALNKGASVQYNGHQPVYETLYIDNLEIFRLLIPYCESVESWHFAAEQENAKQIVAYIKDQKSIQESNKKHENQYRPTDCSN